MISIFVASFGLYEHVLATLLEKRKTISLACILDQVYSVIIVDILLHHQNFSPRNHEISVKWFLLKSVLKHRCEHRISESKWKLCY